MKILITTSSFGKYDEKPIEMLKEKGHDAVLNPYKRKLTKEELLELAKGYEAILAGTEKYDEEVFNKLPDLRLISRCGVGLDNIDLESAKKHGVEIRNTPDAPTEAVSELALLLILSVLRKTNFMDRKIREGIWKKEMGNLLYGKTVGIIGLGRIGRRLVELLRPFNIKIIGNDVKPDITWADKNNIKISDLDELLQESDIVTLHIPYSGDNRHFINSEKLNKMKNYSILINTSRGGLIDENALYTAITSGHLKGAALDVMEKEPYNGPLANLGEVVLTPHVGSYAIESRIRMETEAVENLLKMISEGEK